MLAERLPSAARLGLFVAIALSVAATCGGPGPEQVRQARTEYDAAKSLYDVRNFIGASTHARNAIRLDPDNSEAHLLLGLIHGQRGDHDEAEASLREAIRAHDVLGEASPPGLGSDARNALGVVYIRAGRASEAVPVLTEAANDPQSRVPYLAWGNLAWAHLEVGEPSLALEAANRAIQIQRDFCIGWYRMAQSLVQLERPEEAETALARSLDVEDANCRANQEAWRLRGDVLNELGRADEAVEALERCVTLDPTTEHGAACRQRLESGPEESPPEAPDGRAG